MTEFALASESCISRRRLRRTSGRRSEAMSSLIRASAAARVRRKYAIDPIRMPEANPALSWLCASAQVKTCRTVSPTWALPLVESPRVLEDGLPAVTRCLIDHLPLRQGRFSQKVPEHFAGDKESLIRGGRSALTRRVQKSHLRQSLTIAVAPQRHRTAGRSAMDEWIRADRTRIVVKAHGSPASERPRLRSRVVELVQP